MRNRVGKYTLKREIGHGAMGSVWEAYDKSLHRSVALKLMNPEHAGSVDFRKRFKREARALAQIRNDHIVAIYDYGIDEGRPYIVMEMLIGEDLQARLEREKKLTPARVLTLLQQVASGLTAAAEVGIVHRDLKPANIFIASNQTGELVKILDFGVAWQRPTGLEPAQTTQAIGTPAYMSPEQLHGVPPHHAGDLWAVGVMTYRALTGSLPFPHRSFAELVASVCKDPFVPPSTLAELPPGIDQFFERALAKEPSERFQTARELVEAFAEVVRGTTTTKILVVDDEPDIELLMKMRFREEIQSSLFELFFADNGQTALDALGRHPDTDVILADINMPVMNGLTLLSRIPEVTPFAKTVMVSAYGDMANIRRAMNSGAFDFVTKPIDFEDLRATIDKANRYAADHRQMTSADQENRVLRQFATPAVLERLGASGPSVAFASEVLEATIVYVDLSELASADEDEVAGQLVSMLNANLEIIIPELQARGGVVDWLIGHAVMAVYSGPDHTNRALESCLAIVDKLRALGSLIDEHSPYAHAPCIGISAGQVLRSCVGSRVCDRLAYAVLGEAVEEAARYAQVARPGAILVSTSIRENAGPPFVFEDIEEKTPALEVEPAELHRLLWSEESDEALDA
jgi:serine/threonine protein kinase/class 3 adenylate cyclase